MTAQEYLMQYRNMHDFAEKKREEYLIARSKAESIPSSLANVGEVRSYNNHRSEDVFLKLAEARETYVNAAYDALLVMADIADVINPIPGLDGTVLHERYILRKTWNQIQADLGKASGTVFKAHKRGLKIVQEKLDKGEVRTDVADTF